jgi:hypothetical protein
MIRTTVVLEDDVIDRLQEESRTRDSTFRGTLNDVIRDGLAVAEQRRNSATAFQVKPRAMGLRPGLSYDSISTLLEMEEEDDAR